MSTESTFGGAVFYQTQERDGKSLVSVTAAALMERAEAYLERVNDPVSQVLCGAACRMAVEAYFRQWCWEAVGYTPEKRWTTPIGKLRSINKVDGDIKDRAKRLFGLGSSFVHNVRHPAITPAKLFLQTLELTAELDASRVGITRRMLKEPEEHGELYDRYVEAATTMLRKRREAELLDRVA